MNTEATFKGILDQSDSEHLYIEYVNTTNPVSNCFNEEANMRGPNKISAILHQMDHRTNF